MSDMLYCRGLATHLVVMPHLKLPKLCYYSVDDIIDKLSVLNYIGCHTHFCMLLC